MHGDAVADDLASIPSDSTQQDHRDGTQRVQQASWVPVGRREGPHPGRLFAQSQEKEQDFHCWSRCQSLYQFQIFLIIYTLWCRKPFRDEGWICQGRRYERRDGLSTFLEILEMRGLCRGQGNAQFKMYELNYYCECSIEGQRQMSKNGGGTSCPPVPHFFRLPSLPFLSPHPVNPHSNISPPLPFRPSVPQTSPVDPALE